VVFPEGVTVVVEPEKSAVQEEAFAALVAEICGGNCGWSEADIGPCVDENNEDKVLVWITRLP